MIEIQGKLSDGTKEKLCHLRWAYLIILIRDSILFNYQKRVNYAMNSLSLFPLLQNWGNVRLRWRFNKLQTWMYVLEFMNYDVKVRSCCNREAMLDLHLPCNEADQVECWEVKYWFLNDCITMEKEYLFVLNVFKIKSYFILMCFLKIFWTIS